MKTPIAPSDPNLPGSTLPIAGGLPCQSTLRPHANNPSKTYNDFTLSRDPIPDPIVPRFFALYRQTEIFSKSKTAAFNSALPDRAFPSRSGALATPASLLFPRKYLTSSFFFGQNPAPGNQPFANLKCRLLTFPSQVLAITNSSPLPCNLSFPRLNIPLPFRNPPFTIFTSVSPSIHDFHAKKISPLNTQSRIPKTHQSTKKHIRHLPNLVLNSPLIHL